MKITRESDYAIRITLMLCGLEKGKILGAGEISEAQCIPRQFTLKILRELVGAGFVKSFKGAHGGYCMNISPTSISLKDIITAIDGEIGINDCLSCEKKCNRVSDVTECPVHNRLAKINFTIIENLSEVTFDKLLMDCKKN